MIIPNRRSNLLLIAIASIAIAVAILVGAIFQGYYSEIDASGDAFGIVFAALGILIGIGIFLYGIRRRKFSPLEIIYPLTALYMLNYPIRGLFILAFPGLTRYVYGSSLNFETYLSYALLLFDIGFLAFAVGYFWQGGNKLAKLLPKLAWANWMSGDYWKGILIYGVGLSAFLTLLWSGSGLRFQWVEGSRTTAFYNLLVFFSSLKVVGLYLVWHAHLRQKSRYFVIPYTILFIELIAGIAIGSKQALFQVIVAILFTYYYANRRVASRVFLLAGMFLLILFPLVQIYRDVYQDVLGFRSDPNIIEILSLTDEVSDSFLTESSLTDTAAAIINRANQLDYLAAILHRVPRYIAYQNTLWPNALAAFIPRLLWPGKPTLVLGRYMVTTILGSPSSSNAPVTNIGELYLNFGVLGVPIGMFILGILFRIVYSYLHSATSSRLLQGFLYLSVFPSMLFLSTGIASFPAGITRTLLLSIAILWLFFRQSKRSQLPERNA